MEEIEFAELIIPVEAYLEDIECYFNKKENFEKMDIHSTQPAIRPATRVKTSARFTGDQVSIEVILNG
jgi:hypothetical protein